MQGKPRPSSATPPMCSRFEELALPHLNAAFNLARWLTSIDADAEDVVQQAYLRAFEFFASFHGDDIQPWLMTIVRNTCYTWLKRNRRAASCEAFEYGLDGVTKRESITAPSHGENEPEALRARKDDRRRVNESLENLPYAFREVLVLREMEDLSYKEISSITGIPIGTVMSRLARARTQFARHFEHSQVSTAGGETAPDATPCTTAAYALDATCNSGTA